VIQILCFKTKIFESEILRLFYIIQDIYKTT